MRKPMEDTVISKDPVLPKALDITEAVTTNITISAVYAELDLSVIAVEHGKMIADTSADAEAT